MPPKPPSGSHPRAAPEAEARADSHTPGVPKSARRQASSDADTPRSRSCAAKPDPLPRRQPLPEHPEACAHTPPNAAHRRSGGNSRNEHGMPPARQSGTKDSTVGDPRLMPAASLHLQDSRQPRVPFHANMHPNTRTHREEEARPEAVMYQMISVALFEEKPDTPSLYVIESHRIAIKHRERAYPHCRKFHDGSSPMS